ncbi:MAG: transcription antitermination factor NusB [Acidobacteriota bacterium]
MRRKGREFALQMLFQVDMTAQDPQEILELFWKEWPEMRDVRPFAEALFRGTLEMRPRLDAILERVSAHWKLERMAVVDRNVLRLALYEMVFHPETPPVVVIDEAIEIVKRFGSEESGPFINGILDRLREHVGALDQAAGASPREFLERLENVVVTEAQEPQ